MRLGSGTILIEAAMMANRIPAQYYREDRFAFKRWKEFNLGEWKSIKQQEDRKIGSLDFEYEIWGNDIDLTVLQQAEKNLEYTKLHKRGYRQAVGIAPINEVLAAGMIKLAGWKCD